jgi:Protein of unknown function (DUF1553)
LRSVYLMTKRLTAKPYLQTFDGPDPNVCTTNRDQSVTALQALYFVNDDFLHEQAKHFAMQLLNNEHSDEQRLNHAFSTILCRQPFQQELSWLQKHLLSAREVASRDKTLVQADVEIQAWSSVTRGLMRLNEFLYLD